MSDMADVLSDQHRADVWAWLQENGCTDRVLVDSPIEISSGMISYLAFDEAEDGELLIRRGRPVVARKHIPLRVPFRY